MTLLRPMGYGGQARLFVARTRTMTCVCRIGRARGMLAGAIGKCLNNHRMPAHLNIKLN